MDGAVNDGPAVGCPAFGGTVVDGTVVYGSAFAGGRDEVAVGRAMKVIVGGMRGGACTHEARRKQTSRKLGSRLT